MHRKHRSLFRHPLAELATCCWHTHIHVRTHALVWVWGAGGRPPARPPASAGLAPAPHAQRHSRATMGVVEVEVQEGRVSGWGGVQSTPCVTNIHNHTALALPPPPAPTCPNTHQWHMCALHVCTQALGTTGLAAPNTLHGMRVATAAVVVLQHVLLQRWPPPPLHPLPSTPHPIRPVSRGRFAPAPSLPPPPASAPWQPRGSGGGPKEVTTPNQPMLEQQVVLAVVRSRLGPPRPPPPG